MEDDWLVAAKLKLKRMPQEAKDVRERAMADLNYFAALVNPGYLYGAVHKEIYSWMQDYTLYGINDENSGNKLIMLPRAHLKSHMVATWCAWVLTRNPDVTILYISATAELAITQLYAVKNMLCSSTYQRYFPEYIHPQEGKRDKWSSNQINLDHELRSKEAVRDATVKVAGLTTNTTGWHADVIVADDLVIPENAYTEEGRESVKRKTSQFTSIRNTGGFTMACGTRYHPVDIYKSWSEQIYSDYDEDGVLTNRLPVWDIKEFKVEVDDIFTWPRAARVDGKMFGFDKRSLARIEAEYEDRVQFYAQYYNDPNDPGSDRVSQDKFQYYNQRRLERQGARWFYGGKRLNIYAAVDFAFSLSKAADFTAIVVIGIDCDGNIYVLDIDRFKSDKTKEYFDHIAQLHSKWKFNKLRAEVTVAQKVIVNDIKMFVKEQGLRLSVEEYRPTRHEGSKEERIAAALEHRYDNLKMWHYEGGWTAILEEEVVQARPAHDDCKDALASAIEIAVPPARSAGSAIKDLLTMSNKKSNRFGGVQYR